MLTSGSASYNYNNAGRLRQVMSGTTLKGTYTYNHLGQRTRKVVGSTTTLYHYDIDGNLILETSNTATTKAAYFYANGEPIAQVRRSGTTDTLVYVHTDHEGTPRLATNTSAVKVWSWEGRAFGDTNPNQDPDGDAAATTINFRYGNAYRDSESNLWNMGYRVYDPQIGRFITSDPIGLRGGLNTYAYVDSNPLRWNDPTGLCKVDARFAKLGPGWYHAYIVTTEPNGTQTYFRGGPSAGGPSSGASGAISSGSGGSTSGRSGSGSSGASNSSNGSSPGSGRGGPFGNNGPWGPISTQYGPYLPGTIDYNSGTPPSMNVLDNNEPCGCNTDFAKTLRDVGNASIPYNPFSTNSNAVVRETLVRNGFNPGTPPVWAPGWGTSLPR